MESFSHKAVLFDLDGTLCHYAKDFSQFLTEALCPLFPGADPEQVSALWGKYIVSSGESSAFIIMEHIAKELGLPVPSFLQVESFVATYLQDVVLFPGVREILDELHSFSVRMAIVSNGPRDMQEGTLRTLDLNNYFSVRAISGDTVVGVRKPHADIFHHALSQLHTAPSNALMVGDNYATDIVGAQNLGIAGLHVIPTERAQLREKLWEFLQAT